VRYRLDLFHIIVLFLSVGPFINSKKKKGPHLLEIPIHLPHSDPVLPPLVKFLIVWMKLPFHPVIVICCSIPIFGDVICNDLISPVDSAMDGASTDS